MSSNERTLWEGMVEIRDRCRASHGDTYEPVMEKYRAMIIESARNKGLGYYEAFLMLWERLPEDGYGLVKFGLTCAAVDLAEEEDEARAILNREDF